jgi:S-adenosylmethionine:tRNA ribosyltransferase-isomerase
LPVPESPADYDYQLPDALIAQHPLPERSASRLLVVPKVTGHWRDQMMRDLPGLLKPGDLLVFNDTRVIPARLAAHKVTGGAAEILLERVLGPAESITTADRALVQIRGSKSLRAGMRLTTPGGEVTLLSRREDLWEIATRGPALALFENHGSMPLPPYIERPVTAADRERYQTLFAREPGAVAAPTASLHFDSSLLESLEECGVRNATLTLHVGAGTFQPIRVDDLSQHQMHPERFEVPQSLVDAVAECRAAAGRVIAVGTTVARALETVGQDGELRAAVGESRLFVRPGFEFRVIDGLLTNFHLPQSTLLMLVAALVGRERLLRAYDHAIAARYRFFSYGDAMLIL